MKKDEETKTLRPVMVTTETKPAPDVVLQSKKSDVGT